MSQINVNTIRSRNGGPPNLDKGAVVTGIVTATSAEFAGNVSVGGTLTYEDVTNIDSTGIVTAKSGIFVGNPVSPGIGATINPSGNAVFAGIVTANSLRGDGSLLTGIDATAIQTGNTSVQTVDTGSDGHVKMTTEGGERVRVGPAGQIGLGGANYGSSGQVLTSAGSGSAPTWATPSGGLSHAQQWRLGSNGDLTANTDNVLPTNGNTWAKQSASLGVSAGTLGSDMTYDGSGVFAFPVTGIWKIEFYGYWGIGASDSDHNLKSRIQTTVNNSSYSNFNQTVQVKNSIIWNILFTIYT